MAAPRPVHRMLLYGIILGALTFAPTPSDGSVVLSPAPVVAVGTRLDQERPGAAEASITLVNGERFCRSYPRHRLCLQLVELLDFCDQRPDHRLCADDDDDDDRFCRRHPDHHRCDDDKPPSPS